MSEKKVWNEKAESMSRDEMESVRFEKLEKHLNFCYKNSNFYKDKFDSIGLKPEDVKTWEQFRKLPIMLTKDEERGGQAETRETEGHTYGKHLCVSPKEIIVAKTTGGTSGIPTFSHSYTKNDLIRWNECAGRSLWLAGFRPGDSVLFCFPLTGSYVSSGGLCIDPFQYVGVLTIDVGMEAPMEKILQFALWTKPNALIASPSFAGVMIEKCKEITGKDIKEFGFKKLLLTGEPGIGIPSVRNRIEDAFGGRWCDWLAPNGEGFCSSCDLEEFPGVHEVAPELSICCEDIVDPITKEPIDIVDGAIGEPIVTSLDREGLPYVKYALGDVVQIFTGKCECEYTGPGYRKKILGRDEDVLKVGEVITFPAEIKNTINSFVPQLTGAMRIVLTEEPPDVTPPLIIKLEYGKEIQKEQLDHLGREIKEKLQKNNNIPADIEFVPAESMDRTKFKTPLFEKRYE